MDWEDLIEELRKKGINRKPNLQEMERYSYEWDVSDCEEEESEETEELRFE